MHMVTYGYKSHIPSNAEFQPWMYLLEKQVDRHEQAQSGFDFSFFNSVHFDEMEIIFLISRWLKKVIILSPYPYSC